MNIILKSPIYKKKPTSIIHEIYHKAPLPHTWLHNLAMIKINESKEGISSSIKVVQIFAYQKVVKCRSPLSGKITFHLLLTSHK